jgi:hypothetical protein
MKGNDLSAAFSKEQLLVAYLYSKKDIERSAL